MSILANPAAGAPAADAGAPGARVIGAGSLLGTLVVIVLIGSQLFSVTAALVYSLVLLLHISTGFAAALGIGCGALALWGLAVVAKLAFEAETDPANN